MYGVCFGLIYIIVNLNIIDVYVEIVGCIFVIGESNLYLFFGIKIVIVVVGSGSCKCNWVYIWFVYL